MATQRSGRTSGLSATAEASGPTPRIESRLPARLDRHLVLEEIGVGGFGIVFRAYDPVLDREVAVKRIIQRAGQPEDVARRQRQIQREAQAVAAISHPNVIQIFDVIPVIGGGVLIVMELVRGPTLRAWLAERGRVRWREALHMMIEAGHGLAAAHDVGLVHCDFKPHNVMVAEDSRPRVLDFGLARRVAPASENWSTLGEPATVDQTLSRRGVAIGTPAYMSPEQHAGQTVDAHSDQYAFAVVLFEALYGRRPFDGLGMLALARQKTIRRVAATPRSGVPKALRRVILRGLAPQACDRYPSMVAMLRELERSLHGRRRRTVAVAGVLGVGTVAAATQADPGPDRCGGEEAVAQIWGDAQRASLQEAFVGTDVAYAAEGWPGVVQRVDRYAEALSEAYRQACEAGPDRADIDPAASDVYALCLRHRRVELREAVTTLSGGDPEVLGAAPRILQGLTPATDCGRPAHADPVPSSLAAPVAGLRDELAALKIQRNAGRYADALPRAEHVARAATQLGYEPVIAQAEHERGIVLRHLGRFDEAVVALTEAFEQGWASGMDRVAALAAAQLAVVVGVQRSHGEEGLRWARHAEAAARRKGGDTLTLASVLMSRGYVYEASGAPQAALEDFNRALEIRRERLAADDLQIAFSVNAVGRAYHAGGKHEQARTHYAEALKRMKAALGPSHPFTVSPLVNLSTVLSYLGHSELARDNLELALARLQAAYGDVHPQVASVQINLAVTLAGLGELDGARGHYNAARATVVTTNGEQHPHVAMIDNNLGGLARQEGDHERALALYRQALDLYDASLPDDHPDRGYALTGIGASLVDLGRPQDALAPLWEAVAIREGSAADPVARADGRFQLARALAATGDPQGAQRLAERARAEALAIGVAGNRVLTQLDAWLATRTAGI